MAKNRKPEKPVHPETESSDDDEASTEEETSDSESEPNQFTKKPSSSTPAAAAPATKTPLPRSASKHPRPPQPEPSEDEESGSESESESDSDGPNQKVASVATKSMNEVLKSTTGDVISRSKPAADPVTPSKSAAVKRLAEDKETDSKKSNKKADPESSVKKPTDDSKKPLFQRIWGEDDEIVLLKGMIEFKAKKKADPITEVSAFYDFIKKELDVVDFTRTQLLAKIRRMKKKYLNNQSKEKEGKERILPKLHEQNAYELSKILWGNANMKENGGESVIGSPKAKSSAVKRAPGKRAIAAEHENAKEVKSLVALKDNAESVVQAKRVKFGSGSQEDRILLMGDQMFEEGILAEEWEKLKKEEVDAYLRQMDVKTRQMKFVIDNWKSSGGY